MSEKNFILGQTPLAGGSEEEVDIIFDSDINKKCDNCHRHNGGYY